MQKCFYHAKSDAVTTCMGCKMPVCQACQEEGTRGFCERCMKKVAQLSATVSDTKKTGVMSAHKATMLKSASRPTGPKNVTYCFHHFEAVAAGTCPTCNRAFCPECLTAGGLCTHCAAAEPELAASPAPAYTPSANTAPRRAPAPAAPAPSGGPKPLLVAAIAALGLLVVLALVLHKPAPRTAPAAEPVHAQPADAGANEQAP